MIRDQIALGGGLFVNLAATNTPGGWGRTHAASAENGGVGEDKLLLHLAQVVKGWMGKPAAVRIDPKTWTLGGRTICRVECRASPKPVLKFKGEEKFYVRSGPSTEETSPSEIHAYVGERFEG